MAPLLVTILRVTSLVFVIRAVMSWFNPSPHSAIYPVIHVLYRFTEPLLAPIRARLPRTGPVDLSVIAVLVGINFVLIPIAGRL